MVWIYYLQGEKKLLYYDDILKECSLKYCMLSHKFAPL